MNWWGHTFESNNIAFGIEGRGRCFMVILRILSFLGKREKRTTISSAAIYINIFVLGISLIVFKTILALIRIVL